MTTSADFLTYVLEQLSALKDLTSRRMFGGVGLYGEGVFFGLIANDVLYFKVGEARGWADAHRAELLGEWRRLNPEKNL